MQISREYIERLVGQGKTRRGSGSATEISGGGISGETLANEISNLKAWVKNLTWWGQKFPSGSDVITLRPNSPQGIRIGDAYIVWDSVKKALKVTGNPDSDTADDAQMSIYATGSVSALGLSDSSGGGGGIDFDAMWQALGTDSVNQQIAASHLTTALAGYATQTWVTQNFVKQVKINGTTYSPTNGLVDLGNVGGAAGSVIHKEVGANDLTAESGSFFFDGSGTLKTGYDYVGFQAGNSHDKWQVVAIDNLRWRQNDNGGTDAAGWSDWRTILDTSNWSSTINLTSLGAASAIALSTIQGYFTNGVANTAAKLNTGATTYSVWGQTYWQNGVPKTVVGDIRLMPSGGNTNSDSAKIDFRTLAGDSYVYAPYIQAVNVDSYGKKRLSVFQKNQSDWTTAQVEVFTILPSGFVGIGTTSPAHTLDISGNVHTSGYVQIGSIRMSYDADNNAIKVNGNIYATGAVSALGVNTSGGGGGGGIDIDAMWQALGTDSLTQQISASHLTTALSGYATQSWVTSQNYVKQVRINGTTYSPTNGLVDLGSQSGLEGYLPLTAGSSKALTGSLYLSSRGKGIFMPYTVSGSATSIPLIYDNGENLWIGSTQTTANHHIGQTFISAGHNGTAGNDTIYVCVPNADNNGGTNYAVLHTGNSSVSKSGETLTVKINGTQQSLTNTWRGIQNNLSSESTTDSLSAKQGKVLNEYAEMLQGYIITLQGYFSNGVAKTAAKLNTGATTYTAWGQTYWQNGVPKTVVGDIRLMPSGGNTNSDSAKIDFRTLAGDDYIYAPYIQAVNVDSYGKKRLSVFQKNQSDLTTAQVEVFTILPSGNVGIGTTSPSYKLHVSGTGYYSDTLRVQSIEIGLSNEIYTINDNDLYIQHRNAGNLILCTNGKNVGIGTSSPAYTLDVNGNTKTNRLYLSSTIYLEVANGGVHVVGGGLYADTYVSALGLNDSGGSAFDESAMWTALGTTITQKQISSTYLTNALSGYALQSWVTSQNYVKQVKINGTTYSPTNGLVDLGNVGSAAGSVIHKEVGASDLTAESGSFFFGGAGALETGYDYVGFQAGNSQDKWQMTVIRNLIWRQNDNGGTDAAGWSDWRTILDTSNWSNTINLTSLGAASASDLATLQGYLEGYLPLTAGSSKPLTGSLYLSSRGKGIFMPYTVSGSATSIPLIYDNGDNLWIGSKETMTNHHIGRTYISAGHNGTAGNDTIYVCVPNADNNGGTNYAVLHSGNSSVSKSGETLTVKINDTQQSLTNTWRGIQNNLSSESTTDSLSAKQGKVLYEYAEMLQGYIVTLQGYFTNGVAKTAAKLNTGTTTYTAWGQTYWQNGVPQSVSGSAYFQKGNMLYWNLNDYNSQSTATYSDVLCLGVNSSGMFVGFGSAGLGYPSYFDGDTISLRTGTSRSNAMFINASGNVGIGTTSPSYKLHVAGTGYYTDTLRVQNIEIGRSNEIYSINDYDLYIQHRNAGNLILCTNGKNVGIGTSSPAYTLDVNGNTKTNRLYLSSTIYLEVANGGVHVVGGGLYADTYVSALGANTSSSGSALAAKVLENYYSSRPTTANVKFGDGGLRTFMATSSMDVTTGKPPYDAAIIHCAWDNTGGWEAQLAIGNSSAGVFYRSQNSGTWDFWRTLYDNYSELKPAVDGQYSIGHATGNFASGTDYVGFASLFLSDGSERGWMYVDSDGLTINSTGTIYLGNTVLQTMECSGTGYARSLGVGGSNSSYTLYVNGTTNLNGNVYVKGTLTHSSDMRLKDIEEQRQLSVGDIAAAPLFAFRWKDRSVDGSLHVGTSAQYWQQIVREVVASDAEGMLSIDYGVAAMAGVISIARTTVTLEERIERLEKENETLRQEIERLKAA